MEQVFSSVQFSKSSNKSSKENGMHRGKKNITNKNAYEITYKGNSVEDKYISVTQEHHICRNAHSY